MNKLAIHTLCLVSVFLSACYQTEILSISKDNGAISFYIDEKTLDSHEANGYYFVDFGVSKDSCDEDCVVWEITEKDDISGNPNSRLNRPLIYGQNIEHMLTKIKAQPLLPGKYCAAGTAALLYENKVIDGKIFHKCFSINTPN
mgnify:CR=1 FL=1